MKTVVVCDRVEKTFDDKKDEKNDDGSEKEITFCDHDGSLSLSFFTASNIGEQFNAIIN